MEVDTFFRGAKALFDHDSKENAEQCGSRYASLLHSVADAEGHGGSSIELHQTLHVRVERLEDAQRFGRACNLGEDAEETVAAHKVKCLCEVDEINLLRTTRAKTL